MKLAQALIERADLQRRLASLAERLCSNAQYQEGEQPGEDPAVLLAQYRRDAAKLQQLVVAINLRNSLTALPPHGSITAALAERDRLRAVHDMLIKLAQAAAPDSSRYSRSEIRLLSAVNIAEIRRMADEAAQLHRELDIQIQAANWQHDL